MIQKFIATEHEVKEKYEKEKCDAYKILKTLDCEMCSIKKEQTGIFGEINHNRDRREKEPH